MDYLKEIEIASVILNLLYVILLMRENIWCWICGIIGSALGAYLMFQSKLYSETILYLFYVAIGVYGWYIWHKEGIEKEFKIKRWGWQKHLVAIAIGLAGAISFALFFSKNTDADYPWIDAHTTVFAFVASYMQAHKILSSWIFWIIINGVTVWLYGMKGLDFYSGQMIVYFILSIWGYWEWRKRVEL
ncbi:MAG: nicotinamide riboside transporter PnuC [Bacteroidota bacterium]